MNTPETLLVMLVVLLGLCTVGLWVVFALLLFPLWHSCKRIQQKRAVYPSKPTEPPKGSTPKPPPTSFDYVSSPATGEVPSEGIRVDGERVVDMEPERLHGLIAHLLERDDASVSVSPCAAGPWQEGEPKEAGYYLYMYEDLEGRHLDFAHFEKKEKTSWTSRLLARQIKVLRYAEIHSQYA